MNTPTGKGGPALKADSLTAICEPMGTSMIHNLMGLDGLLQA
jgi:hypothetical protein